MGNAKASSVAPLAPALEPAIQVAIQEDEQPREFHFAVTWVTLFAHLDLIPTNGPWRRQEAPAPTLALVPVAAAPVIIEPPPFRDSNAAWEMVVPKMIRTGSGDFTPVESSQRGS
jgi:hypothetical protein